MKKIFLAMFGVITLACMNPSVLQAGPMPPLMMELQGTVESVSLENYTVVINGTTFRLATDHVLHGITVDGKDQTVLKAGEMVGYQLDENNTKLIRQIMILPHR